MNFDLLTGLAIAAALLLAILRAAIHILPEYERGCSSDSAGSPASGGPGLIFIIPIVDKLLGSACAR
jgi:hypothetical protein